MALTCPGRLRPTRPCAKVVPHFSRKIPLPLIAPLMRSPPIYLTRILVKFLRLRGVAIHCCHYIVPFLTTECILWALAPLKHRIRMIMQPTGDRSWGF
jgi:hypothetical protein